MGRHNHRKLKQSKLGRANKRLSAKMKETVEQALKLSLGEKRVLEVHRRIKSVGGIEDPFK